jgi:hypothetical protein
MANRCTSSTSALSRGMTSCFIGMPTPKDNFYQNPSIGGTPVGFINFIDNAPF